MRSSIWLGTFASVALGCAQELRDPCVPGGEADSIYGVPLLEEYLASAKLARFDELVADKLHPSCGALDGLRGCMAIGAASSGPEQPGSLASLGPGWRRGKACR